MFEMMTCHWNSACPTLLENINLMRQTQTLIHGKVLFFYKWWLIRSSELARTSTVFKPIKSIGSATVTHACAHLFMIYPESVAILNMIDKPAHLAPGSFECMRELIRIVHFWACPWGKILFGETVEKKGRLMTADVSVAG